MNTEEVKKPGSKTADSKRSYSTPKILSREQLEAMAVVCTDPTAKADAVSCPIGPIGS